MANKPSCCCDGPISIPNSYLVLHSISIYSGRKWEKEVQLWNLIPSSYHPSPFLTLFPSLTFVFLPCPAVPPPNPAIGSGEHCELPQWVRVEPWQQTVSNEFRLENHAPLDSNIAEEFRYSGMHCDPCWFCDIPVWYFSEKKWWHSFELAKKVTVWHTTPFPALNLLLTTIHC